MALAMVFHADFGEYAAKSRRVNIFLSETLRLIGVHLRVLIII